MSKAGAPLVIVRSLVYNHEPYLRQCLDGFVMQKTNFKFEVQVHDDSSTDGSKEIILEYAAKYPEIIKPFIEEENQYSKGPNGVWKWGELNSKYVALCEGDDYWTDPFKLQKQVDFMEKHMGYSMCFHAVKIERDGIIVGSDLHSRNNREYSTKKIIEAGGGFCATCSLLMNRIFFEEQPKFLQMSEVGDYPLQILMALKGKIYYFAEEMGVYRFGHEGSWTSNVTKDKAKQLLESKFRWMEALNDYSGFHYKDSVSFSCMSSMVRRYDEGIVPFDDVARYLKQSRINVMNLDSSSRKYYITMFVKFCLPNFYSFVKKIFLGK